MAVDARREAPTWAEGRDTFVSEGQRLTGGRASKQQLEDLYDKAVRDGGITAESPPAAVGGAPPARTGPPRLGFWNRREMRRQLERCRLQVGAEAQELLLRQLSWKAKRALGEHGQDPLEAFDPVKRLVELEREVYRRFGLEPPSREDAR